MAACPWVILGVIRLAVKMAVAQLNPKFQFRTVLVLFLSIVGGIPPIPFTIFNVFGWHRWSTRKLASATTPRFCTTCSTCSTGRWRCTTLRLPSAQRDAWLEMDQLWGKTSNFFWKADMWKSNDARSCCEVVWCQQGCTSYFAGRWQRLVWLTSDICFDLNIARSRVCFRVLRKSCFSELWLFPQALFPQMSWGKTMKSWMRTIASIRAQFDSICLLFVFNSATAGQLLFGWYALWLQGPFALDSARWS